MCANKVAFKSVEILRTKCCSQWIMGHGSCGGATQAGRRTSLRSRNLRMRLSENCTAAATGLITSLRSCIAEGSRNSREAEVWSACSGDVAAVTAQKATRQPCMRIFFSQDRACAGDRPINSTNRERFSATELAPRLKLWLTRVVRRKLRAAVRTLPFDDNANCGSGSILMYNEAVRPGYTHRAG
jgi:hypothetical protein